MALASHPRVQARFLFAVFVSLGCSPGAGTSEPCLHSETELSRKAEGTSALSVLYVVHGLDDVAHAELSRTAPAFLEALRTGDLDGDGVPDFDPPPGVHVAVTTADLGGPPELGCSFDPAPLVTNGGARFVSSMESGFVDEVIARLNAARSACPIGQVFEAVRRALEPDPRAPFPAFVVPSHRLVLVLATATDDCSGEETFALEAPANVACVRSERAALADYVEAFSRYETYALTLTGLPLDVDGLSRPVDGAALSLRADLQERIVDGALSPSCMRDTWSATPPRRFLEWSDLSTTTRVFPLHASICSDDLEPAFDALVDRIARKELASCVAPIALPPRGPDGLLPCALYERDEGCASRPGRELTELGCRIPQRGPGGEGPGWWGETIEDAVEGSDLAWICAPFARLGGDFASSAVLRCAVSSCEE